MRGMAYQYEMKEEKAGRLELLVRKYIWKHPYLGILTMSVGLPIASIAAIYFGTAAVMLPFSMMMGWS